MGRYFIRLDPSGYYKRGEHGFDYEMTGSEWLRQLVPDRDQVYQSTSGFYSPPGFPWVMCRPRQLNPDWLRDSRLANHVMRKELWSFASGITANEFNQDALPGGTFIGGNKWISIPRVPAGVASLNNINYTNLAAATGSSTNFLSGFVTVAVCNTSPVGGPMYGGFHPFLQWQAWPEPAKPVVFGWGDFALVLFRTVSYLLHTPTGDRVTWKLLSRVDSGGKGFFNAFEFQPKVRSEMFMPVGPSNACLFSDGGRDPLRIALAKSGESFLYHPGQVASWWLGSTAGERLSFQPQVVGYETADSTPSTTPAIHFDLGSYRPALAVSHNQNVALWEIPGAGITTLDVGGTRTYTSISTNQQVVCGVRDASYNVWSSNGINSRGSLHLRMVPGNPGVNGAYLSPFLSHYQIQFPTGLVARDVNTVTLDDTQWRRARFSKSLRDPMANKIEVELFDAGAALLSSLGFHRRTNYPIEILEDTDDDGTPDTVRLAGWVVTPGLRLLQPQGTARPGGGTLAAPIQEYHLTARGLLSRMDQRWLYLPQMTNPATPGYVEHTYAVARAMQMSGFDTSDTSRVAIATDPWTGTDAARLPGTWAYQTGQFDTKVDSAWAPDWDETRWTYIRKLCEKWSGWVLYERLNGQARYHPDLQLEMSLRSIIPYYLSGTIYASEAEAAAAGYPHQKYEAGAERTMEWPKANVVRISGTDTQGGLVPHVIDRWPSSIDDDTDEDYLGEEREWTEVPTMAVNKLAMMKMARLLLHRLRRGHESWPMVLPTLAPWHVGPNPMEIGAVFAFSGITGAFLITHLEGDIFSSRITAGSTRSLVRTTATGERLPIAATASGAAGGYPGVGV